MHEPVMQGFGDLERNLSLPDAAHAVQQKLSPGFPSCLSQGKEGIQLLQNVLPPGEEGACRSQFLPGFLVQQNYLVWVDLN